MTYGEAILITILETSTELRRDPGRYGWPDVEPVAIRLMPEEIRALVDHLRATQSLIVSPARPPDVGVKVAGLAVLEVHTPPSLAERYVLRERV